MRQQKQSGTRAEKLAGFGKGLLVLVCVLILLSLLVLLIMKYDNELIVLDRASKISTILRLIIIGVVYWFWEQLICYLAKKNNLGEIGISIAVAQKNKFFLLILVVELLVMQNALSKIFNYLR